MGSLIPVLFYGDAVHEMENDPTFMFRFREAILVGKEDNIHLEFHKQTRLDRFLAKFNLQRIKNKNYTGSSSFAKMLKPMWADCDRVLVIHGNTWIDISDCLYNEKSYNRHKDYLEYPIKFADRVVKELKKKYKENK